MKASEKVTYLLMTMFLPVLVSIVLTSITTLEEWQAAVLVFAGMVAFGSTMWMAVSAPARIELTESQLVFKSLLRTRTIPVDELVEVKSPYLDFAGVQILWVGRHSTVRTSAGYVPILALLGELQHLRPDLEIRV